MDKFKAWVTLFGAKELADKLNVTTTIIQFWLRRQGVPRPATAAKIIKLSKRQLTWDDIYGHLI